MLRGLIKDHKDHKQVKSGKAKADLALAENLSQ